MLTAPSLADPAVDPGRCAKGLAFAKAGDLPHAALYLEGCPGDEAERAAAQVMKKLRASDLSALALSSDPTGATVVFVVLLGVLLLLFVVFWVLVGFFL